MKKIQLLGLAIATVVATGCSAAGGDATPEGAAETTSAALVVGGYNCASLTVASFGATTDLYNPANASSPATLYGFLNAALAQSTADVAHAGTKDYSNTAHEALADLQAAKAELVTILDWLTTNGLSGSNADASYNIAAAMNQMFPNLGQAAFLASISAIGNYSATPGPNAASYVELYSRKALEIANQTGYLGEYCYVSPYGHTIPNAGSFPNMSCSSVP